MEAPKRKLLWGVLPPDKDTPADEENAYVELRLVFRRDGSSGEYVEGTTEVELPDGLAGIVESPHGRPSIVTITALVALVCDQLAAIECTIEMPREPQGNNTTPPHVA